MENIKENSGEPGPGPNQPQHVPVGSSRKDFLRDDGRYKSPALATLMSIMPGLGQIYVGYYQQGFFNIVVIAGIISLLANGDLIEGLIPFFGLFLGFFWLFNMVDAYRKAVFYNQALAGTSALDMPEGERFPSAHGSLFGGVVLVAVGGIALAHTLWGFSTHWIEHWWPIALILMGVYLLGQSFLNYKRQKNV